MEFGSQSFQGVAPAGVYTRLPRFGRSVQRHNRDAERAYMYLAARSIHDQVHSVLATVSRL